jgi:hypothetical protein
LFWSIVLVPEMFCVICHKVDKQVWHGRWAQHTALRLSSQRN